MQGSLARRLRVLRAECGLTLREVEERTGVDKGTLSKIERGLTHPHDATLAKIAKGYGVPVDDLLEELDPTGKASAPTQAGPTEPHDLEGRREYARYLATQGFSEDTARTLAGEYYRSEDWWKELSEATATEGSGELRGLLALIDELKAEIVRLREENRALRSSPSVTSEAGVAGSVVQRAQRAAEDAVEGAQRAAEDAVEGAQRAAEDIAEGTQGDTQGDTQDEVSQGSREPDEAELRRRV